jgi:precorrin-2 dehydrogenase/sirohydrochlorin ferrochelatase
MDDTLPTLLPLAIKLDGRRCLVVGGGPIADRKVAGLRAAGAIVDVVALSVCPALLDRAADDGDVRIEQRGYESSDVLGAWLVVAATGNPAIDGAVASDAHRNQTLVNAVDDPPNCSAYLTAVVRRDPVTVSISTSGASPALASYLRRRLNADLDDHLGDVALLLAEIRDEIKSAGETTEHLPWGDVIDDELIAQVAAGHRAEALERVRSVVRGPRP